MVSDLRERLALKVLSDHKGNRSSALRAHKAIRSPGRKGFEVLKAASGHRATRYSVHRAFLDHKVIWNLLDLRVRPAHKAK